MRDDEVSELVAHSEKRGDGAEEEVVADGLPADEAHVFHLFARFIPGSRHEMKEKSILRSRSSSFANSSLRNLKDSDGVI